ncbi:MAG: hypothetical protein DWQ04_04195 [Chloroflexi bacterium]|nr:MAG: hypothetical protein DWQ04_04195 [Chloroflexota bacterium]
MLQHLSDTQLPGVIFRPAPYDSPQLLPPLDVAAFVGFAERGPLHTPIEIEDVDTYRAIFGGDLALAREEGKETVYAHLPTAVSSYFANGGRRCLVVRVAGQAAKASKFRLPGMISLDEGNGLNSNKTVQPQLVQIQASSVGRWSSRLRLGSRLQSTSLPWQMFALEGPQQLSWQTGSAPGAIVAGDVLKLTLSDDTHWLFPVTAVIPSLNPTQDTTIVEATHVWELTQDVNSVENIKTFEKLTFNGSEPISAIVSVNASDQPNKLILSGDDVGKIEKGDVLWLKDDANCFLAPVSALQVQPSGTQTAMTASAFLNVKLNQTLPAEATKINQIERLRFDLHIWDEVAKRPSLVEMAFNREHPHFWGNLLLLESSSLFDPMNHRDSLLAAQTAAWHRQVQAGERIEMNRENGRLQTISWAGLLAPYHLDDKIKPTYLPLDMVQILTEDDITTIAPQDVGHDGLDKFHPDAFFDSDLVSMLASLNISAHTLMNRAFQQYFVDNKQLSGLHSLLFAQEVALIALPDAVQRPWEPSNEKNHNQASSPSNTLTNCDSNSDQPDSSEAIPSPAISDGQNFFPCDPDIVKEVSEDDPHEQSTKAPESLPSLKPLETFVDDINPLLQIQSALITMCQARQDVVGILSLPKYFEKRHCIEWHKLLRQQLGLPKQRDAYANNFRQDVDLSYTAVYHPWLLIGPDWQNSTSRAVPSDGAICGMIASRERRRNVWVAPANEPLNGVLGLTPFISERDWGDLFNLQVNIIRAEPRDFRPMSAHTLSDYRLLLQLSTRRLLILLRKMALEQGLDFVFENNDTRLRQSAKQDLEILCQHLFSLGAFAGATPQEAFRVITDESINTQSRTDQGQFLVKIQVAPSQPLEFIVVQLLRASEGSLRATEVR